MSILIQNATLICPEGPLEADLRTEGDKIAQIGPHLPAGDSRVIDGSGKLVFPGFIDTHTHFEMNKGLPNETADGWASGTRAALAGGTTTVLDFAELERGASLTSALDTWHSRAEGRASCHYGFHMTIKDWNGAVRAELADMDRAGVSSYKVYMAYDMPWSGMVRVTDAQAGELVSIPKYWLKVQHFPFRVQIADGPVNGYQVSPAHRDREDGQGERDVVYIGRYPCSNSYQSVSGVNPEWLKTLSVYRDNIHALGEEYWQSDYALQLTWWFLYIVEYADWNGELRIGIGHSALHNHLKTGGTDSMSYHTGRAFGADDYVPIQYRYIEDIWGGNNKELRDGIIFSPTEKKFCTYNNPANFSNEYGATGATIRNIPAPPETAGIISAWGYDQDDPSFIFPSEVVKLSSNTDTYISDVYTASSTGTSIAVGRYGDYSGYSGPFFIDKRNKAESSNGMGRIMKLPNVS